MCPVCVGKMKERFYIDAVAEYAKRLGRYCHLEVVELPEQRLRRLRCLNGPVGLISAA